ncbi:hypothetical protein EVAR_85300_1 [Eumeta japonica]|uniref:Uncharacterized protein n=1 Tax=Eumeta variegata TaxID=151549 RepID=A0A4C1V7P6_EUMVA|nr:hypothetical protein EVAR_85300_1 [Eumeta japonica]
MSAERYFSIFPTRVIEENQVPSEQSPDKSHANEHALAGFARDKRRPRPPHPTPARSVLKTRWRSDSKADATGNNCGSPLTIYPHSRLNTKLAENKKTASARDGDATRRRTPADADGAGCLQYYAYTAQVLRSPNLSSSPPHSYFTPLRRFRNEVHSGKVSCVPSIAFFYLNTPKTPHLVARPKTHGASTSRPAHAGYRHGYRNCITVTLDRVFTHQYPGTLKRTRDKRWVEQAVEAIEPKATGFDPGRVIGIMTPLGVDLRLIMGLAKP